MVIDGRMYVTTPWSKVYAFDAKTGKQLWKYDPKVPREIAGTCLCCNISNRGVAYWNGKIIWGNARWPPGGGECEDAARRSGKCRSPIRSMAYSITGAPRIGNGIVFIGQGGGEFYTRGFIAGARRRDRQAAVALLDRAGQSGQGSRQRGIRQRDGHGGQDLDRRMVEDRRRRHVVGRHPLRPADRHGDLRHRQRHALAGEMRSPGGGDNLFIASIVALDAKTGKYKWHYQTDADGRLRLRQHLAADRGRHRHRWPEEARGDAERRRTASST